MWKVCKNWTIQANYFVDKSEWNDYLDLKDRLTSWKTTRCEPTEGITMITWTERLGRVIQVDKLKGVVVCGSRTGSDRWGPQVPDLVSSAQAPLSHPPNLLSFLLLLPTTSLSSPSNSPPPQLHRFTLFLSCSTFLQIHALSLSPAYPSLSCATCDRKTECRKMRNSRTERTNYTWQVYIDREWLSAD